MSGLTLDQAWFILARIEGLGPKRLRAIYEALTRASRPISDVFDLDANESRQLLSASVDTVFRRLDVDSRTRSEREYVALRAAGVNIVHLGHDEYPALLSSRLGDSSPPLLYCSGALPLLASDGIAIVGSRHVALTSITLATAIAGQLAASGQNVISGYASGTDTAAHMGALRAGGTTTIIMSAGINAFAPKRDIGTYLTANNTLVISQFPPDTRWSARNAMARNTVVCALARAVFVVEAGLERDGQGRMSGTFDAGKKALELGVPLFVLDPSALIDPPPGNAELIKHGGISIGGETLLERLLSTSTKLANPIEELRPLRLF